MRRIFSIGLVLLIAWQTLAKFGVFAWYFTNQSYIASTLCVNRDKPEMHCNGKCVLMQRLKLVEEESRQNEERPLRIVEKLNLSHFVVENLVLIDLPTLYTPKERISKSGFFLSEDHFLTILKPPEAMYLLYC